MIRKFIPRKVMLYLSFFRRVGVGKSVLNFITQRVFRINAQVKTPVHFTSIFVGNNLHYDKDDLTIRVSFAVSGSLYIQSLNGIYIGKNVLIAPGVKVVSANHSLDVDRRAQKINPIKIGDNVWIGANAIILPGTEIGNGCVVAAGAVLTKSYSGENLVIAGNPARIIREIER